MTKNREGKPTAGGAAQDRRRKELVALRTIEMVYFVHIDMAAWADQVLARHGIGRPHQRVLYFAAKKPGVSVGELTSLLRVSNQALARTTNQLIALGFLEQRYGLIDRRVRQNYVTNTGSALLQKLLRHQKARVAAALAMLDESQVRAMWHGLEAMIRPEDRTWVTEDEPIARAPGGEPVAANVAYLERSGRR